MNGVSSMCAKCVWFIKKYDIDHKFMSRSNVGIFWLKNWTNAKRFESQTKAEEFITKNNVRGFPFQVYLN